MIVEERNSTLSRRLNDMNVSREMEEDCFRLHLSDESDLELGTIVDQLGQETSAEPETPPTNRAALTNPPSDVLRNGVPEDQLKKCKNENSPMLNDQNDDKNSIPKGMEIIENMDEDVKNSIIDCKSGKHYLEGVDSENGANKEIHTTKMKVGVLTPIKEPMEIEVKKEEPEIGNEIPNSPEVCTLPINRHDSIEPFAPKNEPRVSDKNILETFSNSDRLPIDVGQFEFKASTPLPENESSDSGRVHLQEGSHNDQSEEDKNETISSMEICEEESKQNIVPIGSPVNQPEGDASVEKSLNYMKAEETKGDSTAPVKRVADCDLVKKPIKLKKRKVSSTLKDFVSSRNQDEDIDSCDSSEAVINNPVNGCDTKKDPEEKSIYDTYSNGKFAKLTKHGLEEMIMQAYCDYLVNRGPRGEWRQKCAQLEEERDRLNKITLSLKKQLLDARHIIKKLVEEREISKNPDVLPMKVTRSVGLQVCTTGTFYMRPQSEFKALKSDPFKSTDGNDCPLESDKSALEAQVPNRNASETLPSQNPSPQLSSNFPIPVVTSQSVVAPKSALIVVGATAPVGLTTQAKTPKSVVQVKSVPQVRPTSTTVNPPSVVRMPVSHNVNKQLENPLKTVSAINSSPTVTSQSLVVLPQNANQTVLSQQGSAVITPIKLQAGAKFRTVKPAEASDGRKKSSIRSSFEIPRFFGFPGLNEAFEVDPIAVTVTKVSPPENMQSHMGTIQGVKPPNQNIHFLLATPLGSSTPSIVPAKKAITNATEVIDLTEKEDKEKIPSGPLIKVAKQSIQQSICSPYTSITIDPANQVAKKQLSADSLAMRNHTPMPHKLLVLPLANIVGRNQVGEVISFQDNQKQTLCVLTEKPIVGKNPKVEEKVDDTLIKSFVKLPPLPAPPEYGPLPSPPKPYLRICKATADGGIMLSWNFGANPVPTEVASFELFAFQEKTDGSSPRIWNKVGEVKALPLPMACTLTQFVEGHRYHFAVRAVDVFDRIGEFSSPGSIMLTVTSET